MAAKRQPAERSLADAGQVRIIGGRLRGRKILYSGDLRTRPMKDRVRESVFNLLGDDVRNRPALDLFAGTGALGLEALSRGASRATLVERHFPTAELIRQNVALLGLEATATIVAADVFFWAARDWQPGHEPLNIFCAPPYRLYQEQRNEMLRLIGHLATASPVGSWIFVEADETLDANLLPQLDWDIRSYPPAIIARGLTNGRA